MSRGVFRLLLKRSAAVCIIAVFSVFLFRAAALRLVVGVLAAGSAVSGAIAPGPDDPRLLNSLTMVFSAFAFFAAALYLFVLYGCYRQSAEYFQEADRFLRMVREGRPPSNDAFAYLRRVVEALDRWQTESEKNITMLRAIIESIPDAVVVAAGDGRVVYLNAGAKDVFGVTLEPDTPAGDKKMRGRKRPQWLRDALDAVGGDGKRHGRGDGAVLIEARLQEGGNNNKFLQLRVSPYYAGLNPSGMPVMVSGGMPDGVIIFAHDITGVRRLQAMRDDFVANVSHEIRTPVTAVVGFAETLLGGALDDGDNAVRFMRIIAMHAERLDRMADALTTISDLERGFVRLNKSQVDFSAAADGVIEIFKARAAEKGLRLDALYGAARVIEADTDGLFQILINLVDNAVKFTAAGEINIGICSGGDGGVYSIFVSDTGIGVPGEQVARLGERFFRVDASRARNLGGTGLGLAIVKHIVMANGWEMAFESEEGTGSTVKIFIGKKQPKNYL